jgi:hypothetical protein
MENIDKRLGAISALLRDSMGAGVAPVNIGKVVINFNTHMDGGERRKRRPLPTTKGSELELS